MAQTRLQIEQEYQRRPELNVDWAKFSITELENFLRFLQAEEDLHVEQVLPVLLSFSTDAQGVPSLQSTQDPLASPIG